MPAELHTELPHHPGPPPGFGPLSDVDSALSVLGRPAQPLHGDSRARNVLITRVVRCGTTSRTPGAVRSGDLAFWLELRALHGECWTGVREVHRTRPSSRP
ncbi:hypothetical protein ACRAKI_05605 [Saccharothrix isguenensis]